MSVNVQYQTWGTHLQKFDATLAGGNAPDVIEMGNTEMTKYMAAGAFQDLTADKASFPNSSTWLAGPGASGQYSGKLYGVPYYAGSRVVTYRTDLYKKAGHQGPDEPRAVHGGGAEAGDKSTQEGLLARLHRGHRLVLRDELRLRLRRRDRDAGSGKWKGTLNSPQVDRRPDRVQELLQRRVSGQQDDRRDTSATRTTSTRRARPASIIGPGWFSCCVGDEYKSVTASS